MTQTLTNTSTLQNGKYKIIKTLGQGGFGITYLAEHTLLNIRVCIKEFFPSDYVNRDDNSSSVYAATQSNVAFVDKLRKRFLSEAKNNCQLNHPGIIRIFDIFEENGTAYYVMDYVDGISLGDYIKRNGALPEKTAVEYSIKIAEALDYIHSHNITHYDLKPDNVMLRSTDMSPVIIDFGLSKQYNQSGHAQTSILVGISKGYSPMEQYSEESMATFSPRIDVYSLGATTYTLLTGRIPPEARQLIKEEIMLPVNISPGVVTAVQWGMKPFPEDRCPSAREFIKALQSKKTKNRKPKTSASTETVVATQPVSANIPGRPVRTVPEPAPEPVQVSSFQVQESNNGVRNAILIGAAAIIVVIIAVAAFSGGSASPKESYADEAEEYTVVNNEATYDGPEETVAATDNYANMSNSELLETGRKYYYGQGAEQDYGTAYRYFITAAERGDDEAQFIIGHMYNNGFGVTQDFKEAAEWYLKSAEKGNDRAQYAIGYMYETGHGVQKDVNTAIDWYQRAVDQGNENAEKRISRL